MGKPIKLTNSRLLKVAKEVEAKKKEKDIPEKWKRMSAYMEAEEARRQMISKAQNQLVSMAEDAWMHSDATKEDLKTALYDTADNDNRLEIADFVWSCVESRFTEDKDGNRSC